MLRDADAVDPRVDHSEPWDDVGDVDDDGDHVEDEATAVEEDVGFGGFVQFDDETEEADGHHHVQHAGDEGGGVVEEFEVGFEDLVVRGEEFGGRVGPQERVVVGQEGEEDAQEEGGCCGWT